MDNVYHVLATWGGVSVPMLVVNGEAYVSRRVLSGLLRVDPQTLSKFCRRRKDIFSEQHTPRALGAEDYVRTHKRDFKIKRVCEQTLFISEPEMIALMFLAKGEHGKTVRSELVKTLMEVKGIQRVTPEEYAKLSQKVEDQGEEIQSLKAAIQREHRLQIERIKHLKSMAWGKFKKPEMN